MRELNFAQLMEVYAESNRENGDEFYPHMPEGQRLLQAEQDFYQYLRESFFKRLKTRRTKSVGVKGVDAIVVLGKINTGSLWIILAYVLIKNKSV